MGFVFFSFHKSNMIFKYISTFAILATSTFAIKNVAENEASAKTFIRSKRWNAGNANPDLQKHPDGVYKPCQVAGHKMCDKSAEYWEDIKDYFEKQVWAPEQQVDALETCVSECKKEEGIVGWGGAFRSATNEEKIQNYEEALEEELPVSKPNMKDCNRCIKYYKAVNAFNPST